MPCAAQDQPTFGGSSIYTCALANLKEIVYLLDNLEYMNALVITIVTTTGSKDESIRQNELRC